MIMNNYNEITNLEISLNGYAKTLHIKAMEQADFIGEEIARKLTRDQIKKHIDQNIEYAVSRCISKILDQALEDALNQEEFKKMVKLSATKELEKRLAEK